MAGGVIQGSSWMDPTPGKLSVAHRGVTSAFMQWERDGTNPQRGQSCTTWAPDASPAVGSAHCVEFAHRLPKLGPASALSLAGF